MEYAERVRRHPLYGSLFHRVARCELPTGRYASQWRRYERTVFGTVGRPYGLASGLFSDSVKNANGISERMLSDVFPTPWPGHDDMIAAIYCVAREDVRARSFTLRG